MKQLTALALTRVKREKRLAHSEKRRLSRGDSVGRVRNKRKREEERENERAMRERFNQTNAYK